MMAVASVLFRMAYGAAERRWHGFTWNRSAMRSVGSCRSGEDSLGSGCARRRSFGC